MSMQDDGKIIRITPRPLFIYSKIVLFSTNFLTIAKGICDHLTVTFKVSRSPSIELLLRLYGKPFSTLCPSSAQDQSSPLCCHADEKTVRPFSSGVRYIC